MVRLAWLALPLAALAACASPPAPVPDWFVEARAREAGPLAAQAFGSGDGAWQASVPARVSGPLLADARGWRFALDADAKTPLECLVFRADQVDPAASLAGLSAEAFAAIGSKHGRVSLQRVDRVDAGAIGESPYLAVRWLYRLEARDGARIGEVTHALATRAGRSVYCQHHELGYEATFQRVFAALVEGLAFAASPELAFYSQISTISLGGMRVGFEQVTLRRDGDGDTRIDTQRATLVPLARERLRASDSVAVEFARVDGSLIHQTFLAAVDGELVTNLELLPEGDRAWRVTGIHQARPLDEQIRVRSHPTSWIGEALAARQVIANSPVGGAVTLRRWRPGADPTQILDQTLTIERRVDGERFAARLAPPGPSSALVVDRAGVASADVDAGDAGPLSLERVFSRGTL
jgi:hypothetical protein